MRQRSFRPQTPGSLNLMWSLVIALVVAALSAAACTTQRETSSPPPELEPPAMPDLVPLFDFGQQAEAFRAVDDRVMGGVSQSGITVTSQGHARFAGELSLDNNGGFASVRAGGLSLDISAVSTLVLRVRGDGRTYKLRLHDDGRFDGVAYQSVFKTVPGQWIEVSLPVDAFQPVWRGRLVEGASALNRERVVMVGVMVSDAQVGDFALELHWLAGR